MKRRRSRPVLFLMSGTLALLFSFNQEDRFMNDSIPEIRNQSDFNRFVNAHKVTIIGRYEVLMMPKSKRPGSPLFESQRVTIVLSDSFSVALETHEAGIRTDEERKRLQRKTVRVTGKPYAWAQLWGEPYEQAIVTPAIKDIECIVEIIDN